MPDNLYGSFHEPGAINREADYLAKEPDQSTGSPEMEYCIANASALESWLTHLAFICAKCPACGRQFWDHSPRPVPIDIQLTGVKTGIASMACRACGHHYSMEVSTSMEVDEDE